MADAIRQGWFRVSLGALWDDPAAGPSRPQDFIRSVHRAPRLAEAPHLCFFCIRLETPRCTLRINVDPLSDRTSIRSRHVTT